MTEIDVEAAEKAADEEWDEQMDALTPAQRRTAMGAALAAFERSLADQDAWIGDVFARAAHLERALDEWRDGVEQSVDQPDPRQPFH